MNRQMMNRRLIQRSGMGNRFFMSVLMITLGLVSAFSVSASPVGVAHKIVKEIPVRAYPEGVAFASGKPEAYVTHTKEFIDVIDTSKQQVIDSIKVPGFGFTRIVTTKDGAHAYAIYFKENSNDWGVAVIDTATHKLVKTLSTGEYRDLGLAISPDDKYVYVAASGGHYYRDAPGVVFIDTAKQAVVANVPVIDKDVCEGKCFFPLPALNVSPDNNYVYASYVNGTAVIDTLTHKVIRKIHFTPGYEPRSALSPDGHTLYVVSEQEAFAVNTTSGKIITSNFVVPEHDYSIGATLSQDGSTLYVVSADQRGKNTGAIGIVDAKSLNVLQTLTDIAAPNGLGFMPNSVSTLYVTSRNDRVYIME